MAMRQRKMAEMLPILTLPPPFTLRKVPGTHSVSGRVFPRGHSAARIIKLVDSLDLIGNRTCDFQLVA